MARNCYTGNVCQKFGISLFLTQFRSLFTKLDGADNTLIEKFFSVQLKHTTLI
jgi:hypothetical protein